MGEGIIMRSVFSHTVTRFGLLCAVVLLTAGATFAQSGGQVPKGRIAYIDTGAFDTRINELKRKIDELNAKYEPRTKELYALGDQITGIENQVKQGGLSPEQTSQLAERYEQLKRDYQRRSEDLQKEAQQSFEDSAKPIDTKLRAALEKYATARGIVLVIEIGRMMEKGAVVYPSPGANITDDFINEYNKANP